MYNFNFAPVLASMDKLLVGAWQTIELSCAAMVLGLIVSIICAVGKTSGPKPVRFVIDAYIEIIRNTPFLVQIFFIFFALPQIGIKLNPTVTAIIALALNGGAYAIEIIRGGVDSIPKGQVEAGLALGLHRAQIFRHIILKPALRAVYPSLTSQFIMLTLTTSVCTSIAAYELTSVAQKIEADTFRSFEVYFSITLLYLIISSLMMGIFSLISRTSFSYPVK